MADHKVEDLFPDEVSKGIAEGRYLLVDVREPNEVAVEAYPDGVVVPLSTFDPAAIPDPQGKQVVFARLSFTNLWLCGGERVGETAWRVDQRAAEIPYFPEKWLAEWLGRREQLVPIYAFAKSGVLRSPRRIVRSSIVMV